MALSSKRRILAGRIRLIKNMQSFAPELSWQEKEIQFLNNAIKRIRKDTEALLALEPDGRISYAQLPETKWLLTKRAKTTIGRYLRGIGLSYRDISDSAIENLSYHLAGQGIDYASLPIKVVRGQEIMDAYRDGDKKWHSCMTGQDSNKTELYAINPDKVGLVIYNDKARALLWTTDEGKTVLDRIYPNSGVHVHILHRWATICGYAYRTSCGADYTGLSDRKHYHVTMEIKRFVPFLDTFFTENYIGKDKESGRRLISLSNDGKSFLHWPKGVMQCMGCSGFLWEEAEQFYTDNHIGPYCEDCFANMLTLCAKCLEISNPNDLRLVTDVNEFWCPSCLNGNEAFHCLMCRLNYTTETGHYLYDYTNSEISCEHCLGSTKQSRWQICDVCHEAVYRFLIITDSTIMCGECSTTARLKTEIVECRDCLTYSKTKDMQEESNGRFCCNKCHSKREAAKESKERSKAASGAAAKGRPKNAFITVLPD